MKTVHKLALAKVAYAVVHGSRRIVGLADRCIVNRGGFRFDLDLSQGIDITIFLRGEFEPSTARALAQHITPGSTVVDVGANIGAHTLAMAKHVGETGRVFAFEPTDYAFARLKRNLAINPTCETRVVACQSFLGPSDTVGVPPQIYSSWPLRSAPDLHPKHKGKLNPTENAISRSLDSVLAEQGSPVIQLIKLDVDGFECDVLSGAQATMQRDRPIFLLELAPYALVERGSSLRQLLSFFEPLGYQFYHEKTGQLLPSDERSLSNWIADGESKNVLAMARTRPALR